MRLTDISRQAVLATIAQMPPDFRTRCVSEHPIMHDNHPLVRDESHYHANVGRFLSANDRALGISCEDKKEKHPRGVLWHKTSVPHDSSKVPAAQSESGTAGAEPRRTQAGRPGNVVRDGHYATLTYMASAEFREVKALFESYPEIGGVYFRPTDKGVTVVDLCADSPKPRIGVGEDPYLRCGTTASELAGSMETRVAYLQGVRARQRAPSLENQFEARLIREAQANHLRLPGFPERLRFIHSQWRMDRPHGGTAQLTDLIAVDLPTRGLVLIELKPQPDFSAIEQVQAYRDYFQRNGDELGPFFARVAQVMGALYDCPELASLDAVKDATATLVAWPGASGLPEVQGLEQLERLT